MRDRQKLETILSRRFPGAPSDQVAAAANAIMGLGEEWEEVGGREHDELGYHFSIERSDICTLARQVADGVEFRLLRRLRASSSDPASTASEVRPTSIADALCRVSR